MRLLEYIPTGMKTARVQVYPTVKQTRCIGCGICADACPEKVIEMSGAEAQVVNPRACTNCRACVELCPQDAITLVRDGDSPA